MGSGRRIPASGKFNRRVSETIGLQRLCENSGNTTHGSEWIVQVQPTKRRLETHLVNPTHGSGWIVQVQPTGEGPIPLLSSNPTHGSGWIVQVQPTKRRLETHLVNPTHSRSCEKKVPLLR